jgi:tRNA-Thr(GGU) m(6)t(6)A37 methyltransferase TsaA
MKSNIINMNIELESIGTIHTEFNEIEGMPIQPTGAKGIKGTIEIKDKYVDGLKDLDGFSHIHLIYLLHKVDGYMLEVKPFMDNDTHGVFATRSPKRPNRIGMSVVKVNKVEGNTVHIENVDILNGTPLLDIKPYVPQLYEDTIDELKIGWFETKHQKAKSQKSDDRFK